MTTTTSSIIIVNDGEFRWGADRAELIDALEKGGWERTGRRWVEPENDDPTAAYTALCQAVQPAMGYGPDVNFEADDLPVFRFRPDRGDGVWILD